MNPYQHPNIDELELYRQTNNEEFLRQANEIQAKKREELAASITQVAPESAVKSASSSVVEEGAENVAEQVAKKGTSETGDSLLKKSLNKSNVGRLLNAGFVLSDYNDARESGKSVASSLAKAGSQFVMGEMLGL